MRRLNDKFEPSRGLLALGLCLVGLLSPLSSRGQQEADEPEELGTVHVIAPRIRSALDDPASTVTVITADRFDSEFKTLPEILSHTPGINVQQYGGLGQLSTVSIRGSSAEQVLVLLDGVRLNTGQGGGVDFSTIPLDAVERIEVIRGGGTAVYGPDAIGGVVNIITAHPEGGWRGSAGVTYGSFDTVKAHASAHGEAASTRLLFSVTHFQSEGDFTLYPLEYEYVNDGASTVVSQPPSTGTRINNDFVSEDVLFKADWILGKRWSALLTNNFFFTERGQPGFDYNPLPEARQKVLRNAASLKLTGRDLPFPGWVGTFMPYALLNRIDFRDPTPRTPGITEAIDTESRILSLGAALSVDASGQLASAHHYLHAVAEVVHESLQDKVRGGGESFGRPGRLTLSLAAQDEWLFFNDRLSLIPIVRYLYTEGFGHHITPKGGAILKLTDRLFVKGNIELSYRPPSFSELYHPDQGYIAGNPELEPEEAINSDVGLSLRFPRYSAEAVYFYRKVDESIFWVPVSAFTVQPVNTGPVNVNGAELTAEAFPVDWLRGSLNYTYLHSISRVTGSQLAGKPRHALNGSLSLITPYGEMTADSQFIDDITTGPTGMVVVGWRVQVDLALTIDLREVLPWRPIRRLKRATISIQCKNVGDGHFRDAQYFPLPGRAWFGTFTVVF